MLCFCPSLSVWRADWYDWIVWFAEITRNVLKMLCFYPCISFAGRAGTTSLCGLLK